MITLKKSALSIQQKPARSVRKAARSCSPPAPTPKAGAIVSRSSLGTLPTFPRSSEIFAACEPGSAANTNAHPMHVPSEMAREAPVGAVSVFDQPGDYLWSQLDNEYIVNVLDLLLQCGLASNSGNSGTLDQVVAVS